MFEQERLRDVDFSDSWSFLRYPGYCFEPGVLDGRVCRRALLVCREGHARVLSGTKSFDVEHRRSKMEQKFCLTPALTPTSNAHRKRYTDVHVILKRKTKKYPISYNRQEYIVLGWSTLHTNFTDDTMGKSVNLLLHSWKQLFCHQTYVTDWGAKKRERAC